VSCPVVFEFFLVPSQQLHLYLVATTPVGF
jgi:hypothetical protein